MMRLRAAYAFTAFPLHKLKSGYIEGNVASARAQAAAGYLEVGRRRQEHFRRGRWHDFILTELMRADRARARSPGS
jgi:RimJ/RimL family protein N-acetyltransferase